METFPLAELGSLFSNRAKSLSEAIRALTPAALDAWIEEEGRPVSAILGALVKEALVLKSIVLNGDTDVATVKAPSFTTPVEAADTIESAFASIFESIPALDDNNWYASVRVQGSDRWRGETRSSIAASFLEDFAIQEERLRGVLALES